jgi:subtilisin family serine protease
MPITSNNKALTYIAGFLLLVLPLLLSTSTVFAKTNKRVDKNGHAYVADQIIVKYVSTEVTPGLTVRQTSKIRQAKNSIAKLSKMLRIKTQQKLFSGISQKFKKQVKSKKIARKSKRQFGSPSKEMSDIAENIHLITLEEGTNVEEVLTQFRNNPAVVYAELNHIVEATAFSLPPNDPYYSSYGTWGQNFDDLWGLKRIGAEAAWSTSEGNGVVIAVVDSGVDTLHPDLYSNIWYNSGEIAGNNIDDDGNGFIDDTTGWNFVEDNNDISDLSGHGTHVAAIAAAQGNNNTGIIGVAPLATIMPVRSLDHFGAGTEADMAEGLMYAIANGADIVNNSWGISSPHNRLIEEVVLAAEALDVVLVFAAGNKNKSVLNKSPQNMSNVITVSWIDPFDAKGNKSNFGPFIDVAAPGEQILSASANGGNNNAALIYPGPNNVVTSDYIHINGTSMAAPHVAGVAALILAQRPGFTAADVKQVLRISAEDAGDAGFDEIYGFGIVRADLALNIDSPPKVDITFPTRRLPIDPNQMTIDIEGAAGGAGFVSYSVYRADTFGDWQWLTTSSTAVTDGVLATLDLPPETSNFYLKLEVTDVNNQSYEDVSYIQHRNAPSSDISALSPENKMIYMHDTDRDTLIYLDGKMSALPMGLLGVPLYSGDVYVRPIDGTFPQKISSHNDDRSIFDLDLQGDHIIWGEILAFDTEQAVPPPTASYVQYYNRETGVSATLDISSDYAHDFANMGNGKVLLVKNIAGTDELVSYDFLTATETQLTTGANVAHETVYRSLLAVDSVADVDDNKVVYRSRNPDSTFSLNYLDLVSNNAFEFASNVGTFAVPRISKNKIAWVSSVTGIVTLQVYDIDTGITSTIDSDNSIYYGIELENGVVVYGKLLDSPIGSTQSIYAHNLDTSETQLIATDADWDLQVPKLNGHVVTWYHSGEHSIQYKNTPWKPVFVSPSLDVIADNSGASSVLLFWTFGEPTPDYFEMVWLQGGSYGFIPVASDLTFGNFHYANIAYNALSSSGNYGFLIRACDANNRCGPWSNYKNLSITMN